MQIRHAAAAVRVAAGERARPAAEIGEAIAVGAAHDGRVVVARPVVAGAVVVVLHERESGRGPA